MKFRELMAQLQELHEQHSIDTLDKDVVIRDLNGLDWELESRLVFVEPDRVVFDSTGINRSED